MTDYKPNLQKGTTVLHTRQTSMYDMVEHMKELVTDKQFKIMEELYTMNEIVDTLKHRPLYMAEYISYGDRDFNSLMPNLEWDESIIEYVWKYYFDFSNALDAQNEINKMLIFYIHLDEKVGTVCDYLKHMSDEGYDLEGLFLKYVDVPTLGDFRLWEKLLKNHPKLDENILMSWYCIRMIDTHPNKIPEDFALYHKNNEAFLDKMCQSHMTSVYNFYQQIKERAEDKNE